MIRAQSARPNGVAIEGPRDGEANSLPLLQTAGVRADTGYCRMDVCVTNSERDIRDLRCGEALS